MELPASKLKIEIARVLKEEGFISTYKVVDESKTRKALRLFLKYTPDKRSVISDLRRVSRPGSRRYVGSKEIRGILGGLGRQHPEHPARRDDRPGGAQAAPRRRSALRSLVKRPGKGKEKRYVANWTKTDSRSRRREDSDSAGGRRSARPQGQAHGARARGHPL